MVCAEKKNRLNGFSWARSWFTALKRGVNEMISTEHFFILIFFVKLKSGPQQTYPLRAGRTQLAFPLADQTNDRRKIALVHQLFVLLNR
jgi:hypothetical protein